MISSSSLTTPHTTCGHRGEVRVGREPAQPCAVLLWVCKFAKNFTWNESPCLCISVTAAQSCCRTRRQRGWTMSSIWCSSSTPPCASRSTNSAKSGSWLDDSRTSTLSFAPWRRSNFLKTSDLNENSTLPLFRVTHKSSRGFTLSIKKVSKIYFAILYLNVIKCFFKRKCRCRDLLALKY